MAAQSRAILRLDDHDQRRLQDFASVSYSEVSRLARFAVDDALRRIEANPAEAVTLLKAYRFDAPNADRRIVGVHVDDEFRPHIDALIERIMAATGAKLTSNKAICVALITWLRLDDKEILDAIGQPFRHQATWKENLRHAS